MCSVEVFVDFTYAIYEKLCRISLPLLFPFLLPFLLQFLILLAQLCLRSVTVSANSGKAAAQVTQLVSHTRTHTDLSSLVREVLKKKEMTKTKTKQTQK